MADYNPVYGGCDVDEDYGVPDRGERGPVRPLPPCQRARQPAGRPFEERQYERFASGGDADADAAAADADSNVSRWLSCKISVKTLLVILFVVYVLMYVVEARAEISRLREGGPSRS